MTRIQSRKIADSGRTGREGGQDKEHVRPYRKLRRILPFGGGANEDTEDPDNYKRSQQCGKVRIHTFEPDLRKDRHESRKDGRKKAQMSLFRVSVFVWYALSPPAGSWARFSFLKV